MAHVRREAIIWIYPPCKELDASRPQQKSKVSDLCFVKTLLSEFAEEFESKFIASPFFPLFMQRCFSYFTTGRIIYDA
jgi:hypothetical protein